MTQLARKSVLVTGAGSGIGRATATLGAARGALLTVVDLNDEAGLETVAQIEADGGTAQFVHADIADEQQIQAAVAAAVSAYGRLDGAFNNAAIPAWGVRSGQTEAPFASLDSERLRTSLDVNVVGTYNCMKHEIIQMLEQGGGAIVNTASAAGILAIPNSVDYVTSKHAVIGLTKAAAIDYAKKNIRVNALLPGIVKTGMMNESFEKNPELLEWAANVQPIGRVGEPSELGEAALWLLSDAASFATGASFSIDGGYSMV